jgi:hypothetical protein
MMVPMQTKSKRGPGVPALSTEQIQVEPCYLIRTSFLVSANDPARMRLR